MDHKRITIFTGNFGSGKTEISINFSLWLKEHYEKVAIADLDVVNPYFRSRDQAEELEKEGIKVIYPERLKQSDLPILSSKIKSIINDKSLYGVFDVGGDEDGSIALSSLAGDIEEDEYEMLFVVNTNRPWTSDVEGIIDTKKRIENKSRLSFDGLIANINLGTETTAEDILDDYPLIEQAADEMNLPIKFIAVERTLLNTLEKSDNLTEQELFPLDIHMKPPW